ncbi:MAG: transporter substrate-binding domain-containing protein [Neorhizobium sp.]|nr:transporter substrate-binding domain-containing protein [Neorhizobium sp.]
MNRMMKAGLAGFVTLFACSPAFAMGDTIKTALDGTFAPHAMPTLDGKVEGFNVDLANLIGERLGKKVDITAAQFSSLIPGLQAGTYDFLAAPVNVNKERAASLLFTEGFMDSNFSFTVPASAPDYKTLEDFKGKTIAVNKGSSYESFLKDREKEYGWKVEAYSTNTDAVSAVMTGRADANLAGTTVAAWAVKKNARLKLSYEYQTGQVVALSFRKGDEKNRDLVDKALECLKVDGSMAKLSEKWFGFTPVAGTTIVTPSKGYGTPGFDGYTDDDHKPSCDNLK